MGTGKNQNKNCALMVNFPSLLCTELIAKGAQPDEDSGPCTLTGVPKYRTDTAINIFDF